MATTSTKRGLCCARGVLSGTHSMTSSSPDPDRVPLALLDALPKPNEPVPLMSGRMAIEFKESGTILHGHVVALLTWGRRPCTTLTVVVDSPPLGLVRESYVSLSVGGSRVECLISSFSDSMKAGQGRTLNLTLRLRDTTDFGDGARLRRITFGIVNFTDFIGRNIGDSRSGWAGRLVLEAGGWRVTIDCQRALGDLARRLDEEGGFAITHAGCLERLDGAEFDVAAADGVADALYLLLSLARGHAVSLVLHRGEDESGARVWWRWLVPSVDTWSDPPTWFDEQWPDQLNGIFSTLVRNWSDAGWREAVQLGVYWYVLALQSASTADASTVLAFTGLDLVGWFWLVELEGTHSVSSFDGKDAAERLRLLLRRTGVDLSIPAGLPVLAAHAAAAGWADGPAALAVLRNSTVHPKRRGRVFDAPDPVRWEACTLALWYLELSLLALLGHNGTYINRIERRTSFGLEYVPWATAETPD